MTCKYILFGYVFISRRYNNKFASQISMIFDFEFFFLLFFFFSLRSPNFIFFSLPFSIRFESSSHDGVVFRSFSIDFFRCFCCQVSLFPSFSSCLQIINYFRVQNNQQVLILKIQTFWKKKKISAVEKMQFFFPSKLEIIQVKGVSILVSIQWNKMITLHHKDIKRNTEKKWIEYREERRSGGWESCANKFAPSCNCIFTSQFERPAKCYSIWVICVYFVKAPNGTTRQWNFVENWTHDFQSATLKPM